MQLTLISFAQCPHLLRSSLLLHEKGVAHEVRVIDLADKPDWFKALSTRARVPALQVDGELFDEPDAILELLEELHPVPALHATTPLARARDRSLAHHAAHEIFPTAYRLQIARDEDDARSALRGLVDRLAPLDRSLEHAEFLSQGGQHFGWADVAMAPFAVRAELMRREGYVDVTRSLPALGGWIGRLTARPAVVAAISPSFAQRVLDDMARRDAWLHAHPSSL